VNGWIGWERSCFGAVVIEWRQRDQVHMCLPFLAFVPQVSVYVCTLVLCILRPCVCCSHLCFILWCILTSTHSHTGCKAAGPHRPSGRFKGLEGLTPMVVPEEDSYGAPLIDRDVIAHEDRWAAGTDTWRRTQRGSPQQSRCIRVSTSGSPVVN
jgi:hypothetical protein